MYINKRVPFDVSQGIESLFLNFGRESRIIGGFWSGIVHLKRIATVTTFCALAISNSTR